MTVGTARLPGLVLLFFFVKVGCTNGKYRLTFAGDPVLHTDSALLLHFSRNCRIVGILQHLVAFLIAGRFSRYSAK